MRNLSANVLVTVAMVALGATARAQTNPLTRAAEPAVTVQPAGEATILVLPIEAPPGSANANIGRGIQQDVVADLTTMAHARVIAPPSATPPTDEASALDQGRQASAQYVIWAQAQVSGSQLRVTGQVLDVTAGRPLAGLKATAPVNDLFPLEDSLAAQAAKALPPPVGVPQSAPTAQGSEAQPGSQMQPVPTTPYAQSSEPSGSSGAPYVSGSTADSSAPLYYSYTEPPPTYYTYNPYYYYSYPYAYYYPGWVGYPYWGWGGIGVGFYYGGYWHHGGYWHGGYGHGGYYGGYHGGVFRGGSAHGFAGGGFHSGGGGFHGGGGSHGGGGGGGGHR